MRELAQEHQITLMEFADPGFYLDGKVSEREIMYGKNKQNVWVFVTVVAVHLIVETLEIEQMKR